MKSVIDNVTRLAKLAQQQAAGGAGDRLADFAGFAPNLGNLGARVFVPAGLAPGAALVVVLHGCTQTAAAYDHGSGWSTLAERHGFAVLFPEQRRANNANLCFNWFEPGDIRRGGGEAASIAAMIGAVCAAHGLDGGRVFVTGLSAGGAMTAVMLATYPELFAGGAIIAGLPYGGAVGVAQALERMRGQGSPDDAALDALVRRAAPFEGVRPRLSIWQGGADHTVAPANMDRLVAQWRDVLGVGARPTRSGTIGAHRHEEWLRGDGSTGLETILVAGMGHGTPIDPNGADGCGAAGPYMLDVGLSSTGWLARSWGLAQGGVATRPVEPARAAPAPASTPAPAAKAAAGSVAAVIENALRSAGLMR